MGELDFASDPGLLHSVVTAGRAESSSSGSLPLGGSLRSAVRVTTLVGGSADGRGRSRSSHRTASRAASASVTLASVTELEDLSRWKADLTWMLAYS